MKNSKKKISKNYFFTKLFTALIILILPFFIGLKIVEINKSDMFSRSFLLYKEILFISLLILLAFNLIVLIKNRKIKVSIKSFTTVAMFLLFVVLEITGSLKLVYYNDDFKTWLITTSVGSINYKYVAANVYSEKTIESVIDSAAKKVDIDFTKDIVKYDDLVYENVHYKNELEEEILKHEKGETYKILKVSGTTIGANYHYEGFMAVVYNPADVKLAKSVGAGTFEGSFGETLGTIANKSGAKVAMNAGGFYDPSWNSNGGIPHGTVIIDGKIQSEYTRGINSGGIIGFDYDNKMVLGRMSAQEAIDRGVRDAVDWGPYLIVDGVNYFGNINYYTWTCARTAIGQRADGVVLLLVLDGLQEHSKGASYADLAAVMEKYGAVNASSLDGGTSTAMYTNGQYINKPFNGYYPTFRWLPNAWIVK